MMNFKKATKPANTKLCSHDVISYPTGRVAAWPGADTGRLSPPGRHSHCDRNWLFYWFLWIVPIKGIT